MKSCLGPYIKYTNTNENWWAKENVLSKFTVLCWAAFIAILGLRWPMGHGLDTPGLHCLFKSSISLLIFCLALSIIIELSSSPFTFVRLSFMYFGPLSLASWWLTLFVIKCYLSLITIFVLKSILSIIHGLFSCFLCQCSHCFCEEVNFQRC